MANRAHWTLDGHPKVLSLVIVAVNGLRVFQRQGRFKLMPFPLDVFRPAKEAFVGCNEPEVPA
jgi:hypothetical protein